MLKRQGRALNNLIKRKANMFGWYYIDVAPDFAGRGYCSPDQYRLWVNARESCRRQGDFEGMAHPNGAGHDLWGLRFAKALLPNRVMKN